MYRYSSTILAFFATCFGAWCQVKKNMDYYHTLQSNYVLINPAYAALNEKTELGANYESFRGVQDIYKRLDLYFVNKQTSKLNFGFHIYSDVEQSFSSLTFVKGLINYCLADTEKLKISAGAYVGTVNYWMLPNQFYGGDSEWNFYSQFGVFTQYKKHQFGVSFHHVASKDFIPLGETVGFADEYNFYFKEELRLNSEVKIYPYMLYSVRSGLRNPFYLGIQGQYFDKYDVQVLFEGNRNLAVGANVILDANGGNHFKIGFSYVMHFYNITTESYQVRIAYFFKNDVYEKKRR